MDKKIELKKTILKTIDFKFQWRINVFHNENYISICVINSTLSFDTEEETVENMKKVISILNLA